MRLRDLPFHVQLMTGCLSVIVFLAIQGLIALDAPTPFGFAYGLAISIFTITWVIGLWGMLKDSGPTGKGEAGAGEGHDR